MKWMTKILSIILMMIILVETVGFNHIRHCCGYDDIVVGYGQTQELCSSHEHAPQQSHCHDEDSNCGCNSQASAPVATQVSAYGHHHTSGCLATEYMHLDTEFSKSSIAHLMHIIIPKVIQLFCCEPQPVVKQVFPTYLLFTLVESGRTKLSLFSTLLI